MSANNEEKRGLVIVWTPVPDSKYTAAQVVEQSHRGFLFAHPENNGASNWFFGDAEIDLKSDAHIISKPIWRSWDNSNINDDFNLRGGQAEHDFDIVFVPNDKVDAVKATVEEYVTTNGRGYAAAAKEEAEQAVAKEEAEKKITWKKQEELEVSFSDGCALVPEIRCGCRFPAKIAEIKRRIKVHGGMALGQILEIIEEVENEK